MNYLKLLSIFALFILIGSTVSGVALSRDTLDAQQALTLEDDGTEYYALLVAVGVYKDNPDMDRPSMLVEIENLKNTLLVSEHWKEENIKVITREEATLRNVLNGFKWLDQQEDEDDVCLVFLTTHGFPLLFDRPPFDEADHADEVLAMYAGFLPFPCPWSWEPLANPLQVLTDDMVNNRLNRLESKSVGLIVDSCHSGGFDDYRSSLFDAEIRSYDFGREFTKDVEGQNRVVITSVPETEVSYGSYLTHYLVEGMKGSGDSNGDGWCSMEEAYGYAEPKIRQYTNMRPQLFDNHEGDLLLTENDFPPSDPQLIGDEILPAGGAEFQIVSEDPEGHSIRYSIDWGDGTSEDTELQSSGVPITVTHSYPEERTYLLVAVATDELGASSRESEIVITAEDTRHVDQRQTHLYHAYWLGDQRWCAQKFHPDVDSCSKIEIALMGVAADNSTVHLSLRETLDGPDLASATQEVTIGTYDVDWYQFTFDPVTLDPEKDYYLVCHGIDSFQELALVCMYSEVDTYARGSMFVSEDAGLAWEDLDSRQPHTDAAFVTYT